jgi:hypothetical protein
MTNQIPPEKLKKLPKYIQEVLKTLEDNRAFIETRLSMLGEDPSLQIPKPDVPPPNQK